MDFVIILLLIISLFIDCETVSLSLHSYVINLKDIDDSLCNVLDYQFLHGYSDPTVVFLYAPINTWIGIINSRKDNVKLIAISINLNDQSHPAIWSIPSLPCDTFGLLSIPKPIGGVLVFGANCVIHLNQGVPSYGISLNSFTEANTDFPLETFEDVVISLDCSRFCIISDLGDTIALSTKDGDIYVIFLITDDMRKMKKIHFQKSASSVLCTSICVVQSNHLFLGKSQKSQGARSGE
ncbi:hypothetical protein LOD99_3961 [Oopsacas minuta]|uniref:Uncharacterized protein n=1 Tax=Oopsacas minuta TaxID=111878 RepID=A0AAV7JXU0_9METZ|nr:hypothetical protein LOD99_3961 [Oopsacas minuta]